MNIEGVKSYLWDLIDLFENAERIGASDDVPQGSRYIAISDTYARLLVDWAVDLVGPRPKESEVRKKVVIREEHGYRTQR